MLTKIYFNSELLKIQSRKPSHPVAGPGFSPKESFPKSKGEKKRCQWVRNPEKPTLEVLLFNQIPAGHRLYKYVKCNSLSFPLSFALGMNAFSLALPPDLGEERRPTSKYGAGAPPSVTKVEETPWRHS